MAAEARLLAAHEDTTAPIADRRAIAAAIARPVPGTPRLSPDQAHAATTLAGSGRRLDALVVPAGTGKTRTLYALGAAWELTHGPGSVVALAPSATAAAQLALSPRIGADTGQVDPRIRSRHRAAGLVAVPRGPTGPGRRAAMAATDHLDRIAAQAAAAGAKVVLIGDHCQLGAVDAGGAFALLAGEGHAVELDQLHRFSEDWEAAATRQLRIVDPACLDAYSAYHRLHDGPTEAVTEAAYRVWEANLASGRHSLLLAADTATVAGLNARARAYRVRAGTVRAEAKCACTTAARPGSETWCSPAATSAACTGRTADMSATATVGKSTPSIPTALSRLSL